MAERSADPGMNALVVAAQGGDARAFELLVERHYTMVHGLVLAALNEWDAAEDVTQDIFVIAWANVRNLRHAEAFSVWLRHITRNTCLNWLRKRYYREAVAYRHAQLAKLRDIEPEDPAAHASRKECLEMAGAALRSLSPKLRDAVVMFYIEGLTAAEGARMLGISVDTMKKRLRLGRRKMYEYYEISDPLERQDMLPHKPRRQIQQVMSALVLGPAMPELGREAAYAGPGMYVSDILAGASPKIILGTAAETLGGSWIVARTAIAAATVTVLTAGAGYVVVTTPGRQKDGESGAVMAETRVSDLPEAPLVAAQAPEFAEVDGLSASTQVYLVVERPYPAADGGAGLLPGDKVVKVNGRPLALSVQQDPAAVLAGLPGARAVVTVLRNAGAGETELDIEIVTPSESPFADYSQR